MSYKKNIIRAAGTLSIMASLLLSPLSLSFAQAATGWPSVNGLSAPVTLLVNEAGSWTVKASDPNSEALSYSADWGDASTTTPPVFTQDPTLMHAYAAPGTYAVKFTVENADGHVSHTSATVVVQNPKGSLAISNVAATSTGPTSERITWDTNTRANSSLWLGTSTPVNTSGTPEIVRQARVFHHSITLNNLLPGTTYFAVAGSRDSNRNSAMSSEISFATLPVGGPTIASVNGPSSLDAGTEGTWTLAASDPTNGTLTYAVNWGDTVAGLRAMAMPIIQTSTFSHTYASAGTYDITFTATDAAGLSTTATTSVTVTPAAAAPLTAPTNVTGTSTTEDSITLSWDASTGGVAPITYSVLQDGNVVGTTTDTTFTDTGLSASTSYDYVIEATDSATPISSVMDSATTTVTTLPASAPTIASVNGPSSLDAGTEGTWTLAASDPTNGTLTYAVNWGDTVAGLRAMAMPIIQTSTFSHTYAAAGTYDITFTATNDAGLSTTATTSVTVSETAPAPLTAPADVTSTSTTETSTVLGWTASTGGVAPITYSVMRDGSSVGTTTDTTFTDTGLSASTTYSYVIEATDSTTPTSSVMDSAATTVTTAAAAEAVFTLADIATHNTTADCWTAINGSVYNLTSFIASHPGGVATITSICGIDGSAAFNAMHGSDTIAQAALAPLQIGILGA
ncbi:MAG: PKD domain-containing protein [Candidatus Pacebacteria bacterium]|nr:PKD domain-containing protein [Candidatus Paceibacterota bacterium]